MGTFNLTNRPTMDAPAYLLKVDSVSTAVSYIGESSAGSADDDYTWRIKKLDSTTGTTIAWASGNPNFDKQWSQRTSYEYK